MQLFMLLSYLFYIFYLGLSVFLMYYVTLNGNKEKDKPRMIKCPDCGKKYLLMLKRVFIVIVKFYKIKRL